MGSCYKCNNPIQEDYRSYCPRCGAVIFKTKDFPNPVDIDIVVKHMSSQINPNNVDVYRSYINYTTETLTKYMQVLRAVQMHLAKKPSLFGKQKWVENAKNLLSIFEMLGMSLVGTTSQNIYTRFMSYPDGCFSIFEKVDELERLTSSAVGGIELYLRENYSESLYLANITIQEIVETYNEALTEIEKVLNKLKDIYKSSSL